MVLMMNAAGEEINVLFLDLKNAISDQALNETREAEDKIERKVVESWVRKARRVRGVFSNGFHFLNVVYFACRFFFLSFPPLP